MADTLRELVVSLSLQSDNFSKNIKTVQNQIKEAESRFEAAGAGVDKFAKSTDGLKAKAGMLSEKLRGQNQIVEQYARALNQANATLQRNAQTQQQTSAKLATAKKSQADLNKEVERAKTVLASAEKAYGKTGAVANNAREALAELEDQYAAASAEVKKLEGQLEANQKALQRNADTIATLETALNKAKAAEAATKAELEKTNNALKHHKAQWEAAAQNLEKFGKRATAAGQSISRAGQLLTASITAPLAALGGYAVKASIDAESAFAGVRKTVDMTEEEFAQLNDTLTKMSTTKPMSYTDIAALAETGGQLGIANQNLEMFVSTMADLGVATNLVGQEGAAQLAKFANITNMSQENFSRMGAAIVDLGNNMATTEADIMEMSMRLGAAGSQVGLSEAQILGFAAALSSVGIEAQAGGSAFSKAMIGMQLAVETGKNGLKDYAKVAGMTAKEFQQKWKEDAAGAIQAFIVGLSRMNEEGVSTIKVLNDMGFSEVRLRDTLMRATNASGLFANAQTIASQAWKENVALANEASKRYATTESRITMLKNKTTALARTVGDDLSPAFGDLVDKAGEWLDNLTKMDAGQRQTLLTTAAWLAAIGPGVMLIGKLNTAVGSFTSGLSSLIKTSVEAGGGLKGLLSATTGLLGPAGVTVLTVAAIAGAVAWYDYASGAKAAREATEAMMKTAEEWKNTQATTIFDTGNDPLARFGLSKESFSGGQTELKDWLGRLTDTWTDGKKETNEIVKGYVDEFKTGSDKIRDAIKKRQETQEKYGVTGDKTTEEDLKKLQQYDKEVEKLLKKRKNGKLTDEDQQRLEQIIQERVELQLKYTTGEGGGYDSLVQAVEAEKARLEAENKKPGADLYGDALTGAAQGYQTQVDALNQSYREQYADIMAITDEKEREAALTKLNLEHTQALKKAQEEYNAVVGKYAPEAFETTEIQEAADQMEKLKQAVEDYQSGKIDATELKEFTDSLDEGKLASYVALLKQMEESDLGNIDLGDGITASDLLGGYDTVADYLKAHAGTLTGLGEMLGAVGEEANRVLVDMVLTPEGQTLKDWLDGNKEFTMHGTLDGLPESVTIDATVPVTLTNIPDALTFDATAPVTLTGLPDEITVDAKSPVTLTDVPESLTIEADAPVTVSGLPDGPITIPANAPTTLTGLPDGITIEADAPVKLSGVPDSLTVEADAPVTLSGVPGSITVQAEAPVTLTDVPEDIGIPGATIQSVKFADGVEVSAPSIPDVTVKAKVGYVDFTAIEQAAIDEHFGGNPPQVLTSVGFQTGWEKKLKEAYDSGILTVWKNGAKLELTPEVIGEITAADVWAGGYDENGQPTLDIILTPKLGTKEAVSSAEGQMNEVPQNFLPDVLKSSTADKVESINSLAQGVEELAAAGETLTAQQGKSVLLEQLYSLNPTDLQNIGTYIAAAMAALSSGTLTPEDATALQAQLDAMLAVVRAADEYLGVGNDISAGIADGMKAYGWDGDAKTLATDIEAALRSPAALNSQSPAKKMIPVGEDIAAGVAEGVEKGTYKVENAMVTMARKALAKAKAELQIRSPSRVMRDQVGVMMVRGAALGAEVEAARQQRTIANAFRSLVKPALSGATSAVNNYNKNVSIRQGDISLAGATLVIRDQNDIRALAYELNSLQIGQIRALGGTV
jgi:TP901 family phage tail tape measure protein